MQAVVVVGAMAHPALVVLVVVVQQQLPLP
jgi:hypothetical protein